jgi:hypothetical protein
MTDGFLSAANVGSISPPYSDDANSPGKVRSSPIKVQLGFRPSAECANMIHGYLSAANVGLISPPYSDDTNTQSRQNQLATQEMFDYRSFFSQSIRPYFLGNHQDCLLFSPCYQSYMAGAVYRKLLRR